MRELMNKKIAELSDAQLVEIRNLVDQRVVTPKKNQAEFVVLVALNDECDKRGINY